MGPIFTRESPVLIRATRTRLKQNSRRAEERPKRSLPRTGQNTSLYKDDTGYLASDFVSKSGMGDNLRWLHYRLDRLGDIVRSP
jgi:hypothetical protein